MEVATLPETHKNPEGEVVLLKEVILMLNMLEVMEGNILIMLPMQELLLQVILVVGAVFKEILLQVKVDKEGVLTGDTPHHQPQVSLVLSLPQQILEVAVMEHTTQTLVQDMVAGEVLEL